MAAIARSTQRRNQLAIGRITPAFFGLYSLMTQLAHGQLTADASVVRTTAWYTKLASLFLARRWGVAAAQSHFAEAHPPTGRPPSEPFG
jgi:hypothetical protein